MSQITTHILDTTLGRPAQGVTIILYGQDDREWAELGRGETNADGRIRDLLPTDEPLPVGVYKLKFEVEPYFARLNSPSFYPFVEIVFHVSGPEHYHVPLLLNPFGYATYRGS